MLRIWRHLHLLKRGGRGHSPSGAAGTAPGELAVLCPACPHPNINLPANWKSVPKSSEYVQALSFCLGDSHFSRYLYYQSIGVDACFRFKRRQISSYEKDPELGPGFAYVVAWEPYNRFLSRRTTQNEVSDLISLGGDPHLTMSRQARVQACPLSNMPTRSFRRGIPPPVLYAQHVATNSFSQRVPASSRREKGLPRTPGLLVLYLNCSRYDNSDYVVILSTRHNPQVKKILSYDIICQYAINLRKRLLAFPLGTAVNLDDEIVALVVPKFHLTAHLQECHAKFSLNFEPGAGRRDMEGPERTWYGLQGGGSTKDQGPGYWSDAMDDKFGHWNWSKLVRLGMCPLFPAHERSIRSDGAKGPLLAKKYLNAVKQAQFHKEELSLMNSSLPEDLVQLWAAKITTWENDRTAPNPYYMPTTSELVSN